MSEWKTAVRKPRVIEFREAHSDDLGPSVQSGKLDTCDLVPGEWIETLEGKLFAKAGLDYVIRGVKGEIYPIQKEIFRELYEVLK